MTHRNYLGGVACVLVWLGGVTPLQALAQIQPAPQPSDQQKAKNDKGEGEDAEEAEASDESADKEPEEEGEPAPEGEDGKDVVVNGKRSPNRIDRQVYDVDEDATGTTADALEKVPGVNVTPSGDVTLHGNSVEILVNGKPSPLFSGDNRAAALRAMPSSTLSSIEVMSTPGAQYSSSGAGGIINIVTKTVSPPGMLGSLNVDVTSTGGYSGGGFLQYNAGRFATTTSLNASKYRSWSRNRSSLAELDSSGQPTRSTDNSGVSDMTSNSLFGTAQVDYDAGPFDTITGMVNVMNNTMASQSTGATTIRNASGQVTDQYESTDFTTFDSQNTTLGLGWTHVGKTLGETLKLDAKVTRETMQSDSERMMDYALSSIAGNTGVRSQPGGMDNDATKWLLSADYNGFVGDDQISAGFQLDRDDASQDTVTFAPYQPGVTAMAENPLLSNRFDYRQGISAAYVTYQKALGDHWVVLGGVRAEALDYQSRDAVSGAPVKVAYTNINPSVFATYVISDLRKVRLNYSRRLQRPTPYDLNPSLVYFNDRTVTAGSPALKPQNIDAFEASYEYAKLMTSYSVRAYYVDNDRMIVPVTEIIPDPQGVGRQVILLSRRNAGSSRQTGMQLTYNSRFSDQWSVNANADVYDLSMQLPDLPGERSLVTVSGQFGINYSQGKNTIYLNYYYTGKQLTGDGYSSGFRSGSLSWTRNLTRDIDLTISVRELFKQPETLFVRNTGTVRSSFASSQRAPTFYIGLSRNFATGSFARMD